MSSEAKTGTGWRRRLAKGMAVSALGAAVLTGAIAIPAQAVTTSNLYGYTRTTWADAHADLPGVEAKCRQQDGTVWDATVSRFDGKTSGSNLYIAYVQCQPKRG